MLMFFESTTERIPLARCPLSSLPLVSHPDHPNHWFPFLKHQGNHFD
jgi:hypothetical protein